MESNHSKGAYSNHLFQFRLVERRKLILSLSITMVVMIVEVLGGFITNSIALLSDAGHMFTHAFAIGISLLATTIARKPPCHHKT
ncbi:MAG: cation transporter, partial [Promethearchaeota archaeon]